MSSEEWRLVREGFWLSAASVSFVIGVIQRPREKKE